MEFCKDLRKRSQRYFRTGFKNINLAKQYEAGGGPGEAAEGQKGEVGERIRKTETTQTPSIRQMPCTHRCISSQQ